MKNTLIITAFFPPLGGSGILRTLKFTKFLPHFGWRPVVLTVRPELMGRQKEYEPSLLADFPAEENVVGTYLFNPKRFYERMFVKTGSFQSPEGRILPGRKYSRSITRLKRTIRSFLFIPDSLNGWLPFALWQGLRLIRKNDIDVIFSTSDPYTNHLIALLASRLTCKPWVADFRDPWTQDPLYEYRGMLREWIDNRMERRFLKSAHRITVTTEATRWGFLEKYSDLPPEKVVTITNGFDPDDFRLQQEPLSDHAFIIFYSGRFYGARRSVAFFRALRKFLDKHPHADPPLRAHFVGVFDESARQIVRDLKLGEVVTYWGYVPREEYLCRLLGADAFLFTFDTAGEKDVRILGKVFEYLAAGKPILAAVPEGENARVIRETKSGIVVEPGNVEQIEQALETLYEQRHAQTTWTAESSVLRRYHREQLTAQLCQVFKELVTEVKGGRSLL